MFRHFMAPNDSNVVSWFYVAFPTSSSRDDSSLHLAPRPLQPQIWVIFLVLPHIGPFIFSVYLFLCGRVRPSNTSSRFSTCFVCFQCRFADMQTPLFQPPRMHITGQRIWRMRWKREHKASAFHERCHACAASRNDGFVQLPEHRGLTVWFKNANCVDIYWTRWYVRHIHFSIGCNA